MDHSILENLIYKPYRRQKISCLILIALGMGTSGIIVGLTTTDPSVEVFLGVLMGLMGLCTGIGIGILVFSMRLHHKGKHIIEHVRLRSQSESTLIFVAKDGTEIHVPAESTHLSINNDKHKTDYLIRPGILWETIRKPASEEA